MAHQHCKEVYNKEFENIATGTVKDKRKTAVKEATRNLKKKWNQN